MNTGGETFLRSDKNKVINSVPRACILTVHLHLSQNCPSLPRMERAETRVASVAGQWNPDKESLCMCV